MDIFSCQCIQIKFIILNGYVVLYSMMENSIDRIWFFSSFSPIADTATVIILVTYYCFCGLET